MPPQRRSILWMLLIVVAAAPGAAAERIPASRARLQRLLPSGDDLSAGSLKRFQRELLRFYGGDRRSVPLDEKAAYYEWALSRYHMAPSNQVHCRVILPEEPGRLPEYYYGEDTATWNGSLLAALSYKYAVTGDRRTLELIGRLLEGLHLFQQVTETPGLAARCVLERDTSFADAVNRYVAPDGTVYHYRGDPAKGTYNQLVAGYAACMMHVAEDLPPENRQLARNDLHSLVLHLIDHDYKLTGIDGEPTTYGDLTPVVGTLGIPFNAQVAYMIVATGAYFPPDDPAVFERIRREFKRLRSKHHVYYENPLTHLVCPQRVADNPLVKGMNDRNHVMNAAFMGLNLEIDSARRRGEKPDGEFLYQLGRTMYWGMQRMEHHHNALCNFMWAGILSDPEVFAEVIPFGQERILQQRDYVVATGIEQLRRFPIDRFYYPGEKVKTRDPQWIDARRRHDSYLWKSGPFDRWEISGPAGNQHTCSIDFLYAYWVMRYYRLDELRPLKPASDPLR